MPSAEELSGVATVPPGAEGGAGATTGPSTGPSAAALVEVAEGLAAGGEGRFGSQISQGSKGSGVFVGEGLPPVPARLVERIRQWEYVEMCELLPELLADQKGEGAGRKLSRVRGRKQVQEITAWLQCFAVLVGVVAKYEPEVVPDLMAYMINIVRASQEYEGAAWVAYDAAYRRQAAATGMKRWGGVNSSLYTICFTGKARKSARCDLCLSAAHKSSDCYMLEDEGDMSGRVKAVESAVLAIAGGGPSRAGVRSDWCRLFNERRCMYKNCKYRHVCKWCGGTHAGLDCQSVARRDAPPGPIRQDSFKASCTRPY